VAGVTEVHDLHVWPIAAERLALSAHVRLNSLGDWPAVLFALTAVAKAHGIEHVTFQPAESSENKTYPIRLVKR
jgi:cobalt-zinc-cadmium efflux system protein